MNLHFMIDILTVSCGRRLYLGRLMDSIERNGGDLSGVTMRLFNNGVAHSIEGTFPVHAVSLAERHSVGAVMQIAKSYLDKPLVIKLDDDAEIISNKFFDVLYEIARLKPNTIFSPFPVGLINNRGGPRGTSHEVVYSEKLDRYFTLRKSEHVGGFARVMPAEMFKQVPFTDAHDEDSNVSAWARAAGVEMFYLENGFIVEHQESTLGQHARDESYFQGRF